MTIEKFYTMCENVGPQTTFHIYEDSKYVGSYAYMGYPPEYESREFKWFKFSGMRNVALFFESEDK